jgi:RNA polymerase sigma factor (sigma-70 family)
MTELLPDLEAPSDAELISRVRGGDSGSFGTLFTRHNGAAYRLGRQLTRGQDVDDLVAEAFAKVLHVLQSGGGPDVAFRAYLLTAVRRLHIDRIRLTARLQSTDDMTRYDAGTPFNDTVVADFESGAAARAFASLPERWQTVLWHVEVEGQSPAEVAPLLGLTPNSVSALAYRAREGLRQAFLTMHLAETSAEECRWVSEHLGGYVRKRLSRRENQKVAAHLDTCPRCSAVYLELVEVNSQLSCVLGVTVLGSAAAGYAGVSGAAAGSSAASASGLAALTTRASHLVATHGVASVSGVSAVAVVAVTTAAVVALGGGAPGRVEAGPPPQSRSLTSSPLASADRFLLDRPVPLATTPTRLRGSRPGRGKAGPGSTDSRPSQQRRDGTAGPAQVVVPEDSVAPASSPEPTDRPADPDAGAAADPGPGDGPAQTDPPTHGNPDGGGPSGEPDGGEPGGNPDDGEPGGNPDGGEPGGDPGGEPDGEPGGDPGGDPGGEPGGDPGGNPDDGDPGDNPDGGDPGGNPDDGDPGDNPDGGDPGGEPGGDPDPPPEPPEPLGFRGASSVTSAGHGPREHLHRGCHPRGRLVGRRHGGPRVLEPPAPLRVRGLGL